MVTVHLLFSVYLTSEPLTPKGYYRNSVEQDKMNQLLTTLSSIRDLSFASGELRIELGDEYATRQLAVESFVDQRFNQLRYVNKRLENFGDWARALSEIPKTTDWVLLLNNHDHAFIGRDKNQWNEFLSVITPLRTFDLIQISHWTETLGWSKLRVGSLTEGRKFLYFRDTTCIGAVLIRPELLQSCFDRDFTKGARFVRPDNPFGPKMTFSERPVLVPDTEFFRHLDGYGHVGLTDKFASSLRSNATMSVDGELVQQDWQYAQHPFESDSKDLLLLPSMYPAPQRIEQDLLPNLLYLATRYRFRTRIVAYFVSKFGFSTKLFFRCIYILLLPSTIISVLNPLLEILHHVFQKSSKDSH